jgi:hypothetical protein
LGEIISILGYDTTSYTSVNRSLALEQRDPFFLFLAKDSDLIEIDPILDRDIATRPDRKNIG